jgi:hypothetical protein
MNTRKLAIIFLALAFLCLAGLVWSASATTYYVDNSSNISGTFTSGTFRTPTSSVPGEYVVQTSSGATAKVVGTVGTSALTVNNITGSPDSSDIWTGQSSGAVFTPVASPVVNGSDSNNGTSTSTPWLTIAHVNAQSSLAAGSTVLFRCSCIWREQLTAPTSGSSGSPITFGSYGTGTQPDISGANLYTTWTTETASGTNFTTDANIQGYWYFEQNGNDGTSNGNNLTNNSSVTFSSTHVQGSYSANFSGSNYFSRANASLSAAFPGKSSYAYPAVTMGIWIKPSSVPGALWGIMGTDTGYNQNLSLTINSGGKANFYIRDSGGTTHDIASDAAIPTTGFTLVVGRWNPAATANEISIWVNGVKQSTTDTMTAPASGTNSTFDIGAITNNGGNNYFTGLGDEGFIFNRGLSDAEIPSICTFGLDGTRNNSTLYYTPYSTAPNQVFRDGVRLTLAASKAALATGQYWLDTTNLRIYVYDNPSGHMMEASQRNYCITTNNQLYLTFQNLLAEKSNTALSYGGNLYLYTSNVTCGYTVSGVTSQYSFIHGFAVVDANNAAISNCISQYNGSSGYYGYVAPGLNITYCLAHDNGQLQNNANGGSFYLDGGPAWSGATIQYCTGYNEGLPNYSNASYCTNGYFFTNDVPITNLILSYNKFYNTVGIGLSSLTNGKINYNVGYNNVVGIEAMTSSGQVLSGNHIYNNTFYNQASYNPNYYYGFFPGIALYGVNGQANSCINNIIKNNIAIGFAKGTGSGNPPANLAVGYGGENDGTMGHGNVYTYQCLGPDATQFIQCGGGEPGTAGNTYYSSYSAWQGASGMGAGVSDHYVDADPAFVSTSTPDFHLTPLSPCINAGVNVGLTQDYDGRPVPIGSVPEIGAYSTTRAHGNFAGF